jgi:hypothetical protein
MSNFVWFVSYTKKEWIMSIFYMVCFMSCNIHVNYINHECMVISSLNQYIWCVLQSKCIYFIFYVYCIQAIVINNVCDVYQEMLKQVWCISRQTWFWIMYLVLKQVWCISSKKSICKHKKKWWIKIKTNAKLNCNFVKCWSFNIFLNVLCLTFFKF